MVRGVMLCRLRFSAVVLAVFFSFLAPFLPAQESIFRYDGQTNREGKSTLNIPVTQGQQLLFRVASLDFQPSLALSFNGIALQSSAGGAVFSERFVRIQKTGTVTMSIASSPGMAGSTAGSFQVRVLKYKDNTSLARTGLLKGSISSSDPIDQDGKRIDWYPLSVTKGQKVLIGMLSKDHDSHVYLEMADGKIIENSSSVSRDAKLEIESMETATWWVGAALNLKPGTTLSAQGLPYSLWVRDLPASPKPLLEGAAGVTASLVPVTAETPPLPDAYVFSAPRAGIYTLTLSPTESMPAVLKIRSGKESETTTRPVSKITNRCEQSFYLLQGQTLDMTVEAGASLSRTAYQLSSVFVGTAPLLADASGADYDLKSGQPGFFVYRGKAGEYLEFLMGSDKFRTRLKARDEAGQTLRWANYFGSDYSYASLGGYYFDQPGELVLEASGFNPDDAGRFNLAVRSSLSSKIEVPQTQNDKQVIADDKPFFARLISRSMVYDGSYGAEYLVDLKANELVAASLKSRDFDGRLVLFDPDGQLAIWNDNFDGADSLVEYIAGKTGRYRLRVVSNLAQGSIINTSYFVQLRRNGTANSLGEEEKGSISDENPRSDDGRPYAEVQRTFRAGQHVYFVLSSTDFESRIQLLDKEGLVVDENRGFGQGRNSRIDLTIQKAGTYQLRISSRGGSNKALFGSWSVSGWEIR